jgi:hypothetical protein
MFLDVFNSRTLAGFIVFVYVCVDDEEWIINLHIFYLYK